MPLPEQTALEEFTERTGETASGVLVVPKLIAIDDFRRNQAAARRRVDEAHEMHKFALGFGGKKAEEIGKEVEGVAKDDMGDIIYTGDITLNPGQQVQLGKNTIIKADAAPAVPVEPTVPVKPEKTITTKPAKSLWPKAILACALLAGGSGFGYIVNDLLNPQPAPPPAANDTDTDTITEFDFPKE